jgi:hypothetical protein
MRFRKSECRQNAIVVATSRLMRRLRRQADRLKAAAAREPRFSCAHKRAGNDVSADGNVDEFPDLKVSIQRKWQFAAAKEGHCMLSGESGVSRRAGGKKGQHTTRATKQHTDAAPDGRG